MEVPTDTITETFTALAEPIMTESAREKLVDAIRRLDELGSAAGLMELTKANR